MIGDTGNVVPLPRKRSAKFAKSRDSDDEVYGWVLLLRGLERAAIDLGDHPSLRTLCVMSAYMNQDGVCRVGQDTVAAKLGLTRQAVNKHLKHLDRMEVLMGSVTSGATKRYALNTEGLENRRAGERDVEARRAAKRKAKAASGSVPPSVTRDRFGKPVVPIAPREQPEPAPARFKIWEPVQGPLTIGSRVHHSKFAFGAVAAIEENKITVDFENVGQRRVVSTFIELLVFH